MLRDALKFANSDNFASGSGGHSQGVKVRRSQPEKSRGHSQKGPEITSRVGGSEPRNKSPATRRTRKEDEE